MPWQEVVTGISVSNLSMTLCVGWSRSPSSCADYGIRRHQWVNVSQTLGEESIGFVEIDDGEWDVYFGPLRLADSTSALSSSRMRWAGTTAGATNHCHLCLRT